MMRTIKYIGSLTSRYAFCATLTSVASLCAGVSCEHTAVVIPATGVERSSSGQRWDEALDEVTKELASSLKNKPESGQFRVTLIGLTSPSGDSCASGDAVAEDMTNRMFRHGMQVIERRHLDKVLTEQQLSASDLLDPNSVARVGRLVGADGVVTGTMVSEGTSYKINARIVLVETASVAAVGDAHVRRSEVERHGGTCE